MDAFEHTRLKAGQLHDELVRKGHDPCKSLDLAVAAASHLELEIAWLPTGNSALKGARALFDEQSGTICCEADPKPGDRALLVAHELGHAYLHTGSSTCVASDVDPSRPTEAVQVGMQRVEDYGARERKELQANVFAREFLFPRQFAKQMFVEQRLGAETIAVRLGLPANLIRQQILDALLLPPPPDSAPVTSTAGDMAKPDPSQDRSANHRGAAFQLQAGPGTGKTRTLVKRVRSLVAEGVDPSSILILTFSNRAAGELATRIAAAEPAAAPRLWIGTFHGFGLDLVRRYHDHLDLTPDPSLFDRSDAIEVMEEILPTLPLVHYRNLWDPAMVLRDIVGAISRAKDELVGPGRYRELAAQMRKSATDDEAIKAAEKCLEIADIYDLYEKLMHGRDAIDFGDLIMRPTLLLEGNPSICAAVRLRHRHVLVDEYQDVNRASARLLKAVAGDGQRLWVVGDSRQSIYRFRGASSSNMAKFGSDYLGSVADRLGINYRSTKEVVDAFSAIAPHMGASEGMLPLELEANRGASGLSPEVRRLETPDDEAAGLAASVRELEKSGIALRDQAILCRTNGRLGEIATALEVRGIPVLHLGSLFEREEIRDLLSLLTFAVDRFGNGLARVGAMPRYGLSLQDVHIACQHLQSPDRDSRSTLSELYKLPGISPKGAEGLAQLSRDLDGLLEARISPWDFLTTYLLDRTDLIRIAASGESVSDRVRAVAIWQFLNFIRDQRPSGVWHPIQRALDRVRQLVLLAEERDLRQIPSAALHLNAVRLMTVHGSKGLEFEAVHLPSMNVAAFPSSNRGQRCPPPVGMIEGAEALSVTEEAKRAHEHEEQCLFFVALSRARTHLRLYLAKKQPSGKNRGPSPFLAWLSPSHSIEVADPQRLPLPAGSARPATVSISPSNKLQITQSTIGLFEKCPRRFFYTHVLGLGGARKATAFSRTHDCLYELIEWLSGERCSGNPTLVAAEAVFEEIWKKRGPIEHAFATDYRKLASRLVAALVSSGAGKRFQNSEPLAIDLPNGKIFVKADEVAKSPSGTVILRRIRTGSKRSDEYDRLEYTLYILAGQAQFGSAFGVEAIHLGDETVEAVTITNTKIANRQSLSNTMLAEIAAGRFPPSADAVSCPRCPHFFICSATPPGPLSLS